MANRFKISAEHRQELVELYRLHGMKGVAAKAEEYGVSVKYVTNTANLMGVAREREQGRGQCRKF